jgi:RHS repeat-associated protein
MLKYKDPETGLYQNDFRDYDPSIPRYAQAEPLGLGGGSTATSMR